MTEAQFEKMMAGWKQEAAKSGMGDMMEEWNKVWEEDAKNMGQIGGGMMQP